ncbi:MAG: hypothetical protein ACOC41_04270 [Chitinivibrionales bacterium]
MKHTGKKKYSPEALNPSAVSLACAMVGGFFLFWYTFLICRGKNGRKAAKLLEICIPGFRKPPIGSVIGFLWAYAGGLVAGRIYALLYNMFAAENVEED